MNDPIVVTRSLVKRAWSDIEPKVVWALTSGVATAGVLEVAGAYGVHVPPIVAQQLPLAFSILAAYLTPSVGTTVTKVVDTPTGGHVQSETHSGNTVVTASVPIQQPPAPAPAPAPEEVPSVPASERPFWARPAAVTSPATGPTPLPADENATEVYR